MILRALALALGLLAGAAGACPSPDPQLLLHSCWGEAAAELILLPEEAPPPPATGARRHLLVGAAYTGADSRDGGLPNPVGLFVDNGRVINPNLARMDGVLILPRGGAPLLQHRDRLGFAGRRFDLGAPRERRAFARLAAETGAGVLQSHLLIVDGVLDIRPQGDAPVARRRLFFTDDAGWGVWQTATAVTLHAAAEEIAAALAPRMALNLDMGSFDYCWLTLEDGTTRRCGLRTLGDTARMSNLLSLVLR